ncbi:hypothetical protein GT755_15110 [Herbidospora sp. NEAU-GS84]|uniref:Uncharacterized protein n=2 Tax=Herbidospora solisilvae TaxID=2696284 RepID=A0A7C9P0D3_9ACTN|nr:hypothetical protein [Herbidospora solisilvae]
MHWFYAVWVEGTPVEEAVALLKGDPASGVPDRFEGCWGWVDEDDEGALLAGPIGDWTLLIGDWRPTEEDALVTLTRGGGRAFAVSWNEDGTSFLKYAAGGQVVTAFDLFSPAERHGADPAALDPFMDGLRFDIDDAEPAESFTSALTVIGRVTGRRLDREWLDAPHTTYSIPRPAAIAP